MEDRLASKFCQKKVDEPILPDEFLLKFLF